MNDTTMLHEGLITTKEASKLFRCTSSYLAHLVRTKKINDQQFGPSWLIEEDPCLHFVEQRGKQDAKNTHTHVHPHLQKHQTHHGARIPDQVVSVFAQGAR